MSLGKNIKTLMVQNYYTQKELAIKSRCTESAISRYIHDERKPNVKTLRNLALALGVTVDVLLKGGTKAMVKVIRCKDCKYWGGTVFDHKCRRWLSLDHINCTKPTDYCSYGERKESEVQGE
jgi:transcriptional regulator with XRE-family HTH domain